MSVDDAWNNFESNGTTWETDFSGSGVLSSDIPSGAITEIVPAPSIASTVTPDSGITLGGILNGVTATANTLGGVFGKVYSLANQFDNQKFQQEVTKATLEVNKAKMIGGLELTKAQLDANRQIEIMRAQSGVANAQAQMSSSGGLRASGTPALPAWLPFVGIAFLGYKLLKGKA